VAFKPRTPLASARQPKLNRPSVENQAWAISAAEQGQMPSLHARMRKASRGLDIRKSSKSRRSTSIVREACAPGAHGQVPLRLKGKDREATQDPALLSSRTALKNCGAPGRPTGSVA